MARARNIKPGTMENELLAELDPITRLLFIYLWMLADREGRLEDRPMRIKAKALPYDGADVDGLLDDLQSYGFIVRYAVDGARYIQILTFWKHQKPHSNEAASVIPPWNNAATNDATNEAADKDTATNTATNDTATNKTLNRRKRATYNAYQREYMRVRRVPDATNRAATNNAETRATASEAGELAARVPSPCDHDVQDLPPREKALGPCISDSLILRFSDSLIDSDGDAREGACACAMDDANGAVKPATPPPDETKNPEPAPTPPLHVIDGCLTAIGVSVALRDWERERGKPPRGITASGQHVIDLAALGVSADELRRAYDLAVADREATGDRAPVGAGFVRVFIDKARAPPRPKRDDWHKTDAGITRKAKEVGIRARGGESYASLRDRVFEALRNRGQPGAAA